VGAGLGVQVVGDAIPGRVRREDGLHEFQGNPFGVGEVGGVLGSLTEAEDAVQETYARWYAMTRAQQDAITSPGAWLTRSPAGSAWTCPARPGPAGSATWANGDASAAADGGGLVTAAPRPAEGAGQVARFYTGIIGRTLKVRIVERTVNGQPGLVAQLDGVVTVFAFDVAGDRIKHIWAVRNPEKLRPWTTG
jgi:hypothetical protein